MTHPAAIAALSLAVLALRARAGDILVTEPAGAGLGERLAAALGSHQVHVHSAPATGAGGVAVTLGALDRDLHAEAGRSWVAGHVPVRRRLRRIDTLYGGRDLALIVLADLAPAEPVLDGAATLLAEQRPDVISLHDLPSGGLAGYQRIVRPDGVTWAFGEGAAHRLPPLPDTPAASIAVAFDDRLVCGGLHPTEPASPDGGRWTGAAYATWFAMPGVAPGRWRLRLEIADWGNAGAGFAATFDGAPLGAARRDPHGMTFPPYEVRSAGLVSRLRLLPPRPMRDMRRGPRMIGLRILRAALVPA